MARTYRDISIWGVLLSVSILAGAQSPRHKNVIIVEKQTPVQAAVPTHDSPPEHAATVGQFREYLKLSGVGEEWRAGWIAALEAKRSLGEPYWPESFWTDVKGTMKAKDLAPAVFEVYRFTFSYETMEEVNALLAKGGREAYLASPVGSTFCRRWAMKDEQGKQANAAMTQTLLEAVYEKHKLEIKVARIKYLAEHPDWKD